MQARHSTHVAFVYELGAEATTQFHGRNMANDIKIPDHVRHEFLRRLYSIGLSDESIDVVIDQMWYSFEAGESTERRHAEVREALETSNPLSQRCHKRMKDYWEDLPRLPNGIVLSPTNKWECRWQKFDAQLGRHIRFIERLLENVDSVNGTNRIVNDFVIMLHKNLLALDKMAIKELEAYLNGLDAQENADSDSDPNDLKRLLMLLGDDVNPPDGDDAKPDANEREISERPVIRV